MDSSSNAETAAGALPHEILSIIVSSCCVVDPPDDANFDARYDVSIPAKLRLVNSTFHVFATPYLHSELRIEGTLENANCKLRSVLDAGLAKHVSRLCISSLEPIYKGDPREPLLRELARLLSGVFAVCKSELDYLYADCHWPGPTGYSDHMSLWGKMLVGIVTQGLLKRPDITIQKLCMRADRYTCFQSIWSVPVVLKNTWRMSFLIKTNSYKIIDWDHDCKNVLRNGISNTASTEFSLVHDVKRPRILVCLSELPLSPVYSGRLTRFGLHSVFLAASTLGDFFRSTLSLVGCTLDRVKLSRDPSEPLWLEVFDSLRRIGSLMSIDISELGTEGYMDSDLNEKFSGAQLKALKERPLSSPRQEDYEGMLALIQELMRRNPKDAKRMKGLLNPVNLHTKEWIMERMAEGWRPFEKMDRLLKIWR